MMLLRRAPLLEALILFALAGVLASSSINRAKRESDDNPGDFDSWNERYYGGHSGSSVSIGTGFGFGNPWFGIYPRRYRPMWSYFDFPQVIPWYKGPNVCVETKYLEEPKEFKEMMEGLPYDGASYQQSHQEECTGTSEYYVCKGWKTINGERKMYMTKYTCCHGFIRDNYGPGCIEGRKEKPEDGGKEDDNILQKQGENIESEQGEEE